MNTARKPPRPPALSPQVPPPGPVEAGFAGEEVTDPGLETRTPTPAAWVRMPELGILQPLFEDQAITEIMINDVRNILIERDGKIQAAPTHFQSPDDLLRLTRNILDFTGRILSPDQPYVDVMLPDGTRVNIVAPPLVKNGPCLTLRRHAQRPAFDTLVTSRLLSPAMAQFLQACVLGRKNILICGGTGSGKTTLLNALLGLVPRSERLITLEDLPELSTSHPNSVQMITKPRMPSSPPITLRELVANSLRMRPDRIIVGECRGEEAFDMLQAMNTGHEGSMTTLHANSNRDALSRLETLCLIAQTDLPLSAIRRQISSAVDLVVHIQRLRDGRRVISQISEVTGQEGETLLMQSLFEFEEGRFKAKGLIPTFLSSLKENGIDVPLTLFGNT